MDKSEQPPGISAYVPCYNNEDTIERSVQSLLEQSVQPREVFVVDDGSTDTSRQKVESLCVELLSNERNHGRGYTRARALERAEHEFVLCCDATNLLENDFLEKALPYFDDSTVVSVSGHLRSLEIQGATARWRSRHLFKEDVDPGPARPCNMLITYGTLMRRDPVMEVGNFDSTLAHTEDNELGLRLHAAGYKILGAPDAVIRSIAKPRLWNTLERYWRWYVGLEEKLSMRNYLHSIKASIRPMAQKDLANGDWVAALISLACPHYCMWKTLARKLGGRTNRK